MTTTLETAAALEAEFQRATAEAEDARARRNAAVLALLEQDVRPSVVARRLGLSPGRVSQIAAATRRYVDAHGPAKIAASGARYPRLPRRAA